MSKTHLLLGVRAPKGFQGLVAVGFENEVGTGDTAVLSFEKVARVRDMHGAAGWSSVKDDAKQGGENDWSIHKSQKSPESGWSIYASRPLTTKDKRLDFQLGRTLPPVLSYGVNSRSPDLSLPLESRGRSALQDGYQHSDDYGEL